MNNRKFAKIISRFIITLILFSLVQWSLGESGCCNVLITSVHCEGCQGPFLTKVQNENIATIKFEKCNMTMLSEPDFSKFTEVHYIGIDKCEVLPSIINYTLSVKNLKTLQIDNSNITENFFTNLRKNSNLEDLSLRGNKLRKIQKGFFSPLSRLKKIGLTYTGIFKIEAHAFEGLRDLNEITISNDNVILVNGDRDNKVELEDLNDISPSYKPISTKESSKGFAKSENGRSGSFYPPFLLLPEGCGFTSSVVKECPELTMQEKEKYDKAESFHREITGLSPEMHNIVDNAIYNGRNNEGKQNERRHQEEEQQPKWEKMTQDIESKLKDLLKAITETLKEEKNYREEQKQKAVEQQLEEEQRQAELRQTLQELQRYITQKLELLKKQRLMPQQSGSRRKRDVGQEVDGRRVPLTVASSEAPFAISCALIIGLFIFWAVQMYLRH